MKGLAAGVVLALVGMRVFFAVFRTHLPSGPDIVPDRATWKGAGAPGVEFGDEDGRPVVRLTAASNASASVEFPVASVSGIDAFEVRARCAAEGLRPGRHRYQVGRVLLAFVDAQGKSRWNWPHVAGTTKGTRGWAAVWRRFVVPPDAVSARVILANQGSAGVLAVRDLSVVPVALNPRVPLVFAAWGAVWIVGVGLAVRRLRLVSRPRGRAVLAAALAVLAGMLVPERAIAAVGTGVRNVTRAVRGPAEPRAVAVQGPSTGGAPAAVAPPAMAGSRAPSASPEGAAPPVDLHKAGHLAVFAWLAAVASGCFRIRLVRAPGAAAGLGGLVLFAFAAEQLQWLTLTRSAALADVGYNLIGIAAGLLLAEAWRAWRGRTAA
ncbi:MAG: hypothetical protein FJ221_17800 [Lentisphaerae bacterium]|nr:hypothetical protein [Lentisphaerota bacterium]